MIKAGKKKKSQGQSRSDPKAEKTLEQSKAYCTLWTRSREGEEAALGRSASRSRRLGLAEEGPGAHPVGAGRQGLTPASVRGPRGQGTAIEAALTLVAEGPRRVVQATQATAGQGVAVAHGVGVHVPAALAPLAGLGVPREPQRVPEEAVVTGLTAPPWESRPCVAWRRGHGDRRAAGPASGEGGALRTRR